MSTMGRRNDEIVLVAADAAVAVALAAMPWRSTAKLPVMRRLRIYVLQVLDV